MDINAACTQLLADVAETARFATQEEARALVQEGIELSHAIVGWLDGGGFTPTCEGAERAVNIARLMVEVFPTPDAA